MVVGFQVVPNETGGYRIESVGPYNHVFTTQTFYEVYASHVEDPSLPLDMCFYEADPGNVSNAITTVLDLRLFNRLLSANEMQSVYDELRAAYVPSS